VLKPLLFCLLLAGPALPQTVDLNKVLKGVENRYNSAKTLRAEFTQTVRVQGRTRTPEKGVVYLSRPKKTRWEYSVPQGRVFVSDGKYTHDYDPRDNTYSREEMKETDDTRVPLAFLMGNLDFQKDFSRYETRFEGADAVVKMFPRNQNAWFTEITMTVAPDFSIRRVLVVGQDFSTTEFLLSNEVRNLPVADALFRYTPPSGAKVVNAGQ
jgi:outer membrane lipoprotein carrier protein